MILFGVLMRSNFDEFGLNLNFESLNSDFDKGTRFGLEYLSRNVELTQFEEDRNQIKELEEDREEIKELIQTLNIKQIEKKISQYFGPTYNPIIHDLSSYTANKLSDLSLENFKKICWEFYSNSTFLKHYHTDDTTLNNTLSTKKLHDRIKICAVKPYLRARWFFDTLPKVTNLESFEKNVRKIIEYGTPGDKSNDIFFYYLLRIDKSVFDTLFQSFSPNNQKSLKDFLIHLQISPDAFFNQTGKIKSKLENKFPSFETLTSPKTSLETSRFIKDMDLPLPVKKIKSNQEQQVVEFSKFSQPLQISREQTNNFGPLTCSNLRFKSESPMNIGSYNKVNINQLNLPFAPSFSNQSIPFPNTPLVAVPTNIQVFSWPPHVKPATSNEQSFLLVPANNTQFLPFNQGNHYNSSPLLNLGLPSDNSYVSANYNYSFNINNVPTPTIVIPAERINFSNPNLQQNVAPTNQGLLSNSFFSHKPAPQAQNKNTTSDKVISQGYNSFGI